MRFPVSQQFSKKAYKDCAKLTNRIFASASAFKSILLTGRLSKFQSFADYKENVPQIYDTSYDESLC